MGYIRFLLAALVVTAHCNVSGWTIGATAAVQVFFLISGFYMAATYSKNYDGPNRAISFFASRYTRLYPMYLTLVLITGLVWYLGRNTLHLNTTQTFDYFALNEPHKPDLRVWSLFFQDLSPSQILNLPVRQSWSISAELAFYALVPLLFKYRGHLLWIAGFGLLLKIALFGAFGFGPAYFPFYANLWYFALGMWLYLHREALTWSSPQTAKLLTVVYVVYLLIAHNSGFEFAPPWRHLLLIGVTMLVVPSCFAHVNDRLSVWFGDLSYGVYIAQFLAIEIFVGLGLIKVDTNVSLFSATGVFRVALVLALAITFAAVFETLVQSRIDAWRRRTFSGSKDGSPAVALVQSAA